MNTAANPSMVDRRSTVDILKEVADNINNVPLKTNGAAKHGANSAPASETQNLLNLASESVGRIFDHGVARIKKAREVCDVAEAALTNKRNAVTRSMDEYLKAVELVQTSTEDMDKALSIIISAADAVGYSND